MFTRVTLTASAVLVIMMACCAAMNPPPGRDQPSQDYSPASPDDVVVVNDESEYDDEDSDTQTPPSVRGPGNIGTLCNTTSFAANVSAAASSAVTTAMQRRDPAVTAEVRRQLQGLSTLIVHRSDDTEEDTRAINKAIEAVQTALRTLSDSTASDARLDHVFRNTADQASQSTSSGAQQQQEPQAGTSASSTSANASVVAEFRRRLTTLNYRLAQRAASDSDEDEEARTLTATCDTFLKDLRRATRGDPTMVHQVLDGIFPFRRSTRPIEYLDDSDEEEDEDQRVPQPSPLPSQIHHPQQIPHQPSQDPPQQPLQQSPHQASQRSSTEPPQHRQQQTSLQSQQQQQQQHQWQSPRLTAQSPARLRVPRVSVATQIAQSRSALDVRMVRRGTATPSRPATQPPVVTITPFTLRPSVLNFRQRWERTLVPPAEESAADREVQAAFAFPTPRTTEPPLIDTRMPDPTPRTTEPPLRDTRMPVPSEATNSEARGHRPTSSSASASTHSPLCFWRLCRHCCGMMQYSGGYTYGGAETELRRQAEVLQKVDNHVMDLPRIPFADCGWRDQRAVNMLQRWVVMLREMLMFLSYFLARTSHIQQMALAAAIWRELQRGLSENLRVDDNLMRSFAEEQHVRQFNVPQPPRSRSPEPHGSEPPECHICMDRLPTVALTPCGHTFCEPCVRNRGRCPMCKTLIASFLNIFL